MEESLTKQTTELVIKDFGLQPPKDQLSEEELFDMLADEIAYMIERNLEYLFSLMYRLDIDENKVNKALSPRAEEPANIGLTRLVLERQRQRIKTKKYYKQKPNIDLEDLEY
ncbi:MAG: hypothetical protein GY705_28875 [Bacteroidetes bacterium]|nr:hypothetical protein [Bacteroidota bacterium]